MTVKELIDKLKTLPANAPVMVQGYEDGYDAVKSIREIRIIKNSGAQDWNGEYEEAGGDDKNAVSAAVIMGNRR